MVFVANKTTEQFETYTHKHARTHASTHTRAHTHRRTHAHTHRRTHAHTHKHTHTQAHTHKRTHTHTHTHAHMHAHEHSHSHTHTHTHTHIHTHMRTHTHTHTHTHTPQASSTPFTCVHSLLQCKPCQHVLTLQSHLVKLLLDECSNVLLNVELLQSLQQRREDHRSVLQFLHAWPAIPIPPPG